MIEVAVTGHICVDVIPEIPAESARSNSFLAPGRLIESGALSFTPGGSVSNTGVALHILGAHVRLVGKIGTDRIAQLTRDVLAAHDPDLPAHLAVSEGEPSAYTIVLSPPETDRTFIHCPGPNNTFGPEDLDAEVLAEARIMHFGYPPLMRRMYADGGQTLAQVMAKAEAAGATTSLDLAMPDPARPAGQADWRAILTRALPHVDFFVPSVEELLFMFERDAYDTLTQQHGPEGVIDALTPELIERLAQRALGMGARVVFLKLGHRGAYLRSGKTAICGRGAPSDVRAWRGRQLWAPAYRVQVRGTVGAGDATIAGFLTALLHDQSPAQAANSAAAVGACNVEQYDAASGLLCWEATQQRIAAGWRRQDCGLDACPEWRLDPALDVYRGPLDAMD